MFIDATHIKASANKKKNRKVLAEKTTRVYNQQHRAEIEAGRDANGKKPRKDKDDDSPPKSGGHMVTERQRARTADYFTKASTRLSSPTQRRESFS